MSNSDARWARSASEPGARDASDWGASALPSGVRFPARDGGASNREAGAVHTYGKLLDQTAGVRRSDNRYRDMRVAGQLLDIAGESLAKSGLDVRQCRHVRYDPEVSLQRSENSAWLQGVKTCGKVWYCPCCSAVISRRRRDELNDLLKGARAEGFAVVMVTLTARHRRGMRLAAWLDAFRAAQERLRQRREWRALRSAMIGTVAATEVTHSDRNGFHPHVHLLCVMDMPEGDAVGACDGLRDAWLASLAGVGLSATAKGWRVQSASAAGDYVAKFGAAEDMTLATEKHAGKEGRTPWQILSDISAAGKEADPQDRAIWIEYAQAFFRRRQLVWSPGLKARFAIGDVSDDDAAEAEADAPEPVTVRVWDGPGWVHARKRKSGLLAAAMLGRDLDAVERGPTDFERWQNASFGSVIE